MRTGAPRGPVAANEPLAIAWWTPSTQQVVTFGCAVWKAVTALTQTPLSGLEVALFHQLRVTRAPALELVDELEPAEVPLLLLHAAIVAAAAPPLWRR